MTEINVYQFGAYVLLGLAGGIAGYLLRRLEKFDETSDSFRALTLTQISVIGDLLLESITQVVKGKIGKEKLKTIFESIDSNMKKQIFEQGGVALMEDKRRKKITEFYFAFTWLVKGSTSEEVTDTDLKTLFTEEEQDIGGISIKEIKNLVNEVQSDLKAELKYYRWKLPLILITLFGILAAVSAIITFIQSSITGS